MTDRKTLKSVVGKIKARIDDGQKEGAENPPWIKQVAMLTGVLAAVSGFLAVRSTTLTNDAIYESNLAILAQTEASDAWTEYEAESVKAHVAETALTTSNGLDPDARAALGDEAAGFRDRQPKLKQTAAGKTAERDEHLKGGLKLLDEKDLLGYAGLAAQLGIALASVAALVRWRTPFVAGIVAGVIGIGITVYAFAAHYGMAM